MLTGAGSTLTIQGTSGWDILKLFRGSVIVEYNGQRLPALDAEAFNARSGPIRQMEVISGPGGGYFDFRDSPVPVVFFGGDGNDEVYGSPFNDVIYCGGGSDFVRGGDGADEIYGMGSTGSRLYGGNGEDVIQGGDGGDFIYGGAGADIIVHGASDHVQDQTAEDDVSESTPRAVKRALDRINSRYQSQQNVVSPQQGGVQVSAAATPQITTFTISQNVVTEGESVVFTVTAAEPNWARLVLFVDEDGNHQYNSSVDTELGQFRGRNQNWRGQIGTAKLGPGTYNVYAMLLPFSGSPAISSPITLTVQPEVVLPEPPGMPDSVTIDPADALVLLPHRNGDVTVTGNTLVGDGIDLWEVTPRTGGGFAFWTEGSTDTIVAVYDSAGNRIGNWDRSNGPGENGELVVTLSNDTTYYFAVAAELGDGGNYDLHVTGQNQTIASEITLSPSTHAGSASASFSGSHRLDYVKVVSPDGATLLDVSVAADPSLDLWVRVADESNNLIGLGRPGDQVLTDLPVTPNTVYYVTFYAMYGTNGSYTVSADFYPDQSGLPANMSPSPAADWLIPLHDGSISVDSVSIDTPSEFDYYLLTPPGSGTVHYVISTGGALDTRMGLYVRNSDSNSTLLVEDDDGGDGRNARLAVDLTGGNSYLLVVRSGSDETGAYSIQIASPAPTAATLTPAGLEATVDTSVQFIANNEHYVMYRTEVPAFANELNLTLNYVPNAGYPGWVLDASVRITDAQGNLVRLLDANGQQGDEAVQHLPVTPGATYYITVAGNNMTIGTYQLHLNFDPDYPVTSGSEFPASTVGYPREWPAVARNATGQGVIVWSADVNSTYQIRGLRIGADGQPIGTEFRIDQDNASGYPFPAVAVAPDGSFVVTWDNLLRRFNAAGTPLTGSLPFVAAEQYPGSVALAMAETGEFVVVWSSFSHGDPDGGVFAQRFAANASQVGSEIHVNEITLNYQDDPDVAYLPNGNWVVAWTSYLGAANNQDIRAKVYSGGTAQTGEFAVNTDLPRWQNDPAIAASPDGYGYVVVWRTNHADGSCHIHGQRFDAANQPVGSEFQATTRPTDSSVYAYPDVAFGSQGRFLVTSVVADTDQRGIAGQQFTADGSKSGPELLLNQVQTAEQYTPAVASNHGDKFLVVWWSSATNPRQIRGREFTLQNILEPEITVRDDVGDAGDLAMDFGDFSPGDPLAAHVVTVLNDGNADLTVSALALTGPGAARFQLANASDFTLAPGQHRDLSVLFNPTTAGSADAVLTFNHNDTSDLLSGDVDPNPLSVSLTGRVIAPPELDVTVLPGDIPENAGTRAAMLLVTRRNALDVDQPLTITLDTSDPSEATVPAVAEIPTGEMSVLLYADAVDDNVHDGTQTVTISAFASGFRAGSGTLLVESVNHAPNGISCLSTSVPENAPAGSVVGTPTTTDPDAGDTFTYSLVDATNYPDNASFTVDSSGNLKTAVAFDYETKNSYSIRVQTTDQGGLAFQKAFTIAVTNVPEVQGRKIFYNRSTFDDNNAAANAADDAAIATDKTALLPGVMASFANYTGYSRGINGIMVDIDHLPGTPNAGDFALRVGNGNPPTWSTATASPTVSVRTGAGVGGADRITLIWSDNAIQKTWLEITVLATTNTGLAANDVFYFGNAIGETGYSNLSDRALVNTSDVGKVRLAVPAINQPVTNVYDVNRDGRVNTSDVGVTRNNTPLVLWLITPTLPTTAGQTGGATPVVSLDQPGLPGLYDPATSMFYLRNSTSAGAPDTAFGYGRPGAGWQPIAGDWDGDGQTTVGLFDPAANRFYLRNTNTSGYADVSFGYGAAGSGQIVLTGDWDGDGIDTIGLYDRLTAQWYLRDSNTQGYADMSFGYGVPGSTWTPIAGDWNGDGIDTVGLYDPSTGMFYLRDTFTTGVADVAFAYGVANSGWTPLVGDWNNDGVETIGMFLPSASTFYLRNTNTQGAADAAFGLGDPGCLPIVGDWLGRDAIVPAAVDLVFSQLDSDLLPRLTGGLEPALA